MAPSASAWVQISPGSHERQKPCGVSPDGFSSQSVNGFSMSCEFPCSAQQKSDIIAGWSDGTTVISGQSKLNIRCSNNEMVCNIRTSFTPGRLSYDTCLAQSPRIGRGRTIF